MKKLFIYSVLLLFLMLNVAAGCGSNNNNDPNPQTKLALVGGRWEMLFYKAQTLNSSGKITSESTFGPGLGYIFNSDGTYDGCAMTLSDWTFPSGTPNNDWQCTSKGSAGKWQYQDYGNFGKLTISPVNRKALSYNEVELASNGEMIWENEEKDPQDGSQVWITARLKRTK